MQELCRLPEGACTYLFSYGPLTRPGPRTTNALPVLVVFPPTESAILLAAFAERRPGRAFDDACPSGLFGVGQSVAGDGYVTREPADGVGRAARPVEPALSFEARDKGL